MYFRLALLTRHPYPVTHKDVFLREYVELLHTLVGNEMLRSHNGRVFFKTGLSNWEAYVNVVPEIVFSKLRDRLLVLEGSFIAMPPETARTHDAVLDAMVRLFEPELEPAGQGGAAGGQEGDGIDVHMAHFWGVMEYLTKLAIENQEPVTTPKAAKGAGKSGGRGHDGGGKAGAPRGPADDGKGAGGRVEQHGGKGAPAAGARGGVYDPDDDEAKPWPRRVATAVARVGWNIQAQLLGQNLVKYYSEWCNTPMEVVAGMAYNDTIILYDTPKGNVEHVADDSKELNVYLGCPHNLLYDMGDPVLAAAQERVEEIYKNTYWANDAAYMCTLAALALAKRGCNVDYMFLLLGTGGVGLSITSAHLHAMLGPKLHKFGDPNVFFNDEELRKQIEQMQGAIAFTF